MILKSTKENKLLKSKIAELKEKVEGYERTISRLIEMGFPTFKSCREYAEKLEKLEEEIEDLKEAKARMTQKSYDVQVENNKLKKQIEKMKCCYNCKHTRTEYEHCITDKHEKWELKE